MWKPNEKTCNFELLFFFFLCLSLEENANGKKTCKRTETGTEIEKNSGKDNLAASVSLEWKKNCISNTLIVVINVWTENQFQVVIFNWLWSILKEANKRFATIWRKLKFNNYKTVTSNTIQNARVLFGFSVWPNALTELCTRKLHISFVEYCQTMNVRKSETNFKNDHRFAFWNVAQNWGYLISFSVN